MIQQPPPVWGKMNDGIVMAIDPGPVLSGFVLYERGASRPVLQSGKLPTQDIITRIRTWAFGVLIVEQFQCYGRPVGAESFVTIRNSGRFEQVWLDLTGRPAVFQPRSVAARELCHNVHAKDAHIRQAIIDRFGGSRRAAVGVKACPGPVYGVKADAWLALAHAIAWCETQTGART
jgi:hypothetical protein